MDMVRLKLLWTTPVQTGQYQISWWVGEGHSEKFFALS